MAGTDDDATEPDLRRAAPAADLVAQLLEGQVRAELFGPTHAPRLGRLVVLEPIGSGAMGSVFAAYDPKLDRKVAVKVLRGNAGDEATNDRLLEEARALSKLSHPNVVAVHDAGEAGGAVFIVMELVPGPTLGEWLEQDRRSWRSVVRALRAAGEGLAAAHRAGLVHCDFKPGNVIVGDRVRVLDFGLARPARFAGELAVAGTPNYMAPEVLCGGEPSAASDQFAFAVTAFEALYGQRPYAARTLDALREAAREAASAPRGRKTRVPRRIHNAIVRALAADPAERHASMETMLAQLAPSRRRRSGALTAVVGTAAALGIVGALTLGSSKADVCAGGGERVEELWTSEAGRGARRVLTDESPWRQRALSKLEEHAARWVSSHRRVCEATRVDGAQSDALLELRMRCLDRGLDRTRELVAAIATIEGGRTAARVGGAVASLGDPAGCEAVDDAAELALPADPSERAALVGAYRELDRGWAAYQLGRYREAIVAADARVRDRAYHGAQLLLAGSVEGRIGAAGNAGTMLTAGLEDAAAARAFSLETRIWAQLLRNQLFGGEPTRVLEWAPFARAAARRSESQLGEIEGITGEALRALGDLGRARETLERARELTVDRPDRRALVLMNLGAIELRLGRPLAARALFLEGRELTEKTFGAGHPQLALFSDRLGDAALARGDIAAASSQYASSIEVRRLAFGAGDRALASSRLRRGRARLEAGDLTGARDDFAAALAARVASYGPDHRRTAEPLEGLADVAIASGDLAAAAGHLAEAARRADAPRYRARARLAGVTAPAYEPIAVVELSMDTAFVLEANIAHHLAADAPERARSAAAAGHARWSEASAAGEPLAAGLSLVVGRALAAAGDERAAAVWRAGLAALVPGQDGRTRAALERSLGL